jgi:hypothetical protein
VHLLFQRRFDDRLNDSVSDIVVYLLNNLWLACRLLLIFHCILDAHLLDCIIKIGAADLAASSLPDY